MKTNFDKFLELVRLFFKEDMFPERNLKILLNPSGG